MTADPDQSEARLRRSLDAVANQPALADAWTTIRDRSASSGTVVPFDALRQPRRIPSRWIAAAAVLLVAAAMVGTFARSRTDDASQLSTAPAAATGWYIPVGLPRGWKVESIAAVRVPPETDCPCWQYNWVSPDGRASIEARWVKRGDASRKGDPVDLGHGGGGQLILLKTGAIAIASDDGRLVMTAQGLSADRALTAARALNAHPSSTAPPLPALRLLASWRKPTPNPVRVPIITVSMRSPSGTVVAYTLVEPGTFRFLTFSLVRIDRRAQTGGPVIEMSTDDPAAPPTLMGIWPGADVKITPQLDGQVLEPSAAEAATVMAALRPASASRWHAFVARAPHVQRGLVAATLHDLGRSGGRQPRTTTTTTPEPAATYETGLLDHDSIDPVLAKMFPATNGYGGSFDGQYNYVMAGSAPGFPTIGYLLILKQPQTALSHAYLPVHGALTIVRATATGLVLTAADGTNHTYNLVTRHFD